MDRKAEDIAGADVVRMRAPTAPGTALTLRRRAILAGDRAYSGLLKKGRTGNAAGDQQSLDCLLAGHRTLAKLRGKDFHSRDCAPLQETRHDVLAGELALLRFAAQEQLASQHT